MEHARANHEPGTELVGFEKVETDTLERDSEEAEGRPNRQ